MTARYSPAARGRQGRHARTRSTRFRMPAGPPVLRRLQLAPQRRRLPGRPSSAPRCSTRCRSARPRTPSSTSSSPPRRAAGAPLLAARVPRACIDLNRAPDDLDPALIAGAARRYPQCPHRRRARGDPARRRRGPPDHAGQADASRRRERRIADCWHPYHDRLRTLLAEARDRLRHGDPVSIATRCRTTR